MLTLKMHRGQYYVIHILVPCQEVVIFLRDAIVEKFRDSDSLIHCPILEGPREVSLYNLPFFFFKSRSGTYRGKQVTEDA